VAASAGPGLQVTWIGTPAKFPLGLALASVPRRGWLDSDVSRITCASDLLANITESELELRSDYWGLCFPGPAGVKLEARAAWGQSDFFLFFSRTSTPIISTQGLNWSSSPLTLSHGLAARLAIHASGQGPIRVRGSTLTVR
jgi:hypothetical protein